MQIGTFTRITSCSPYCKEPESGLSEIQYKRSVQAILFSLDQMSRIFGEVILHFLKIIQHFLRMESSSIFKKIF